MSDPEDQFDDVRTLARWKRFEQPPPGYFNSFSAKVITRIQAQEAAEYSSWWSWFVDRFDAKPVLVCVYGLAVSGLLFFGFRLSQVFQAGVEANPAVSGPWLATTPGSPVLFPHDFIRTSSWGASAGMAALLDPPTPALRAEPAQQLFPGGPHIQSTSYQLPGF
jgi:hypothetical protein